MQQDRHVHSPYMTAYMNIPALSCSGQFHNLHGKQCYTHTKHFHHYLLKHHILSRTDLLIQGRGSTTSLPHSYIGPLFLLRLFSNQREVFVHSSRFSNFKEALLSKYFLFARERLGHSHDLQDRVPEGEVGLIVKVAVRVLKVWGAQRSPEERLQCMAWKLVKVVIAFKPTVRLPVLLQLLLLLFSNCKCSVGLPRVPHTSQILMVSLLSIALPSLSGPKS